MRFIITLSRILVFLLVFIGIVMLSSSIKSVALGIMFSLLGIAGLVILKIMERRVEKEEILQRSKWENAQGTVTYFKTSRERDDEGDVYYKITLEFTYEVEGIHYSGEQSWDSESDCSITTPVAIYYNPGKPAESTFQPERLSFSKLGGRGVILAVYMFLFFVVLLGVFTILLKSCK
jgi:hypothetical protein